MKDILHFGGLKMQFLKVAETFCSMLYGCRWSYIWHFGFLKMRFLAGCETLGSRVHGVWWQIFLHYDGPKKKFLPIYKSVGDMVHVFMRKTFYQFGILKMRSLRDLRISAHGYLAWIWLMNWVFGNHWAIVWKFWRVNICFLKGHDTRLKVIPEEF